MIFNELPIPNNNDMDSLARGLTQYLGIPTNSAQYHDIIYLLQSFRGHLSFIPIDIVLKLENAVNSIHRQYSINKKLERLGKQVRHPFSPIAGIVAGGSFSGLGSSVREILELTPDDSDLDYAIFVPENIDIVYGADIIDSMVNSTLEGGWPGRTCDMYNATYAEVAQAPVLISDEKLMHYLDCLCGEIPGKELTASYFLLSYFGTPVMVDPQSEAKLNESRLKIISAIKSKKHARICISNLAKIWMEVKGIKPKHLGLETTKELADLLLKINYYTLEGFLQIFN